MPVYPGAPVIRNYSCAEVMLPASQGHTRDGARRGSVAR
jgi:hypothetical protein